ncbi:MAG: type II secretion system F family protein [Acidobacteriota bacterium]
MTLVIIFVVAWLGAMLLVWLLWSARRGADVERIKSRVVGGPKAQNGAARKGPALMQRDDQHRGKLLVQLVRRLRLMERLKVLIEQAGSKWDVARTIHGCVALSLAAFAAVWYMAPLYRYLAPVLALAGGALPILWLRRARRRRLAKFEEMFPESLEFLARSMRAGHAFTVALELIHTEFQEPLAGEFRRAFDEQNLGLPLEMAFERMSQRVPLLDVRFFVAAVLLQRRTGGNLAELLDKLAYLIRERFKLRGRIRAISAHGRMTGTVLSLVPAAVASIMFWVNPDFILFFFNDETGQLLAGGAVGLQILGYVIIRKIVAIEVY